MEDLKRAQQLANGIYWLGMRRDVRLEPNTYLLLLEGHAKTLPLLIDPGGPNVFKIMLQRLQTTLGDIHKLRLIFLSYQCPDVGLNIVHLLKRNPALTIVCTDDVWRLAYSLGIPSAKFRSVESFKDGRMRLPTGHVLRFLAVPFCPSRGACMLYDEQNRILFSGGLFGGVTFTPSLFATPEHWDGIRMWHQMYIPTQQALKRAVKIVRALKPRPAMIAPQHGAILEEDLIPDVLDKLSDLPVGMDLIQATAIDKLMYIEAINDVLDTLAEQVGRDVIENLLHRFDADLSFPRLFTAKQGRLIDIKDDILGDVMGGFRLFMYALIQEQPPEIQEIIREAIIESNWDISTFMQTFVHRKNN